MNRQRRFVVMLLVLAGLAVASAPAQAYSRLDVSGDFLQWRYLHDDHFFGVQGELAWQFAQQHRAKIRVASLRNDVRNPFQLLGDVLACAMSLGFHDRCDRGDPVYQTYQEQALLYQYRLADSAEHALWLGIGPARVIEKTRRRISGDDNGSRTLDERRHYGAAWDLQVLTRGKRTFATLKLEGNSRGSAAGVSLGFGLSLF